MKNQYMFFKEQKFEECDLGEYSKKDITIPKTDVHIYQFECQETEEYSTDDAKAKKLDKLTQTLESTYADLFQIINSESSQYFCGQIYPLVVKFETKLRYVFYISRSLFENGNVNKESFLLEVDKKKKEIEEIDFGKIYEAIFTDKDLQGKVKEINGRKLTKADLIKEVQLMDENTMWRQIVGTGYTYIENHFLEIINYRNDVMHNHLMSFEECEKAKTVMQQAVYELDRAVNDKLIENNNDYLNDVNIVDVLNGIFKAMGTFAKYVSEASNSEHTANIVKTLSLIGEKFAESLVV